MEAVPSIKGAVFATVVEDVIKLSEEISPTELARRLPPEDLEYDKPYLLPPQSASESD